MSTSLPTDLKPMLAGKFSPVKQSYPVYIQPKYDGIRCVCVNEQAFSRTLKLIPNKHIQAALAYAAFHGLDGELVVGPPTDDDCYRKTVSAVMSAGGTPDFRYYVFDIWNYGDAPFKTRLATINAWYTQNSNLFPFVIPATTILARNEEELNQWESKYVGVGWEGVILRDPQGQYKFGRSTPNEGALIKLKRFIDAEAVIVDFEELKHNDNPALLDALGHTTHSSHQENMIPGNTLGALVCRKKDSEGKGQISFKIGTGFSAAERKEIWDNRNSYLGKIAKFKYATVGGYNVPRFPVFLGWRDARDQ